MLTKTSAGARNTPVELNDPNLKCYKLTAYASAANKAQKYSAPTTPDYYVGFNFLGKQMQGRCWIRFITSVAERCGGRIEGPIRVTTRNVDEQPDDQPGHDVPTFARSDLG